MPHLEGSLEQSFNLWETPPPPHTHTHRLHPLPSTTHTVAPPTTSASSCCRRRPSLWQPPLRPVTPHPNKTNGFDMRLDRSPRSSQPPVASSVAAVATIATNQKLKLSLIDLSGITLNGVEDEEFNQATFATVHRNY
ncbi:unnamed protein product [Lactuca virosa]|uniref:Uncharacterized protein n=1 Tax=Lactuca virosa TaxID=75947 RepID=A0AAU9M1T4_9ASTR|nr:unnamed protein product [Lactuca virosa]